MGRSWPPVDQALPVPGLAFRPLPDLPIITARTVPVTPKPGAPHAAQLRNLTELRAMEEDVKTRDRPAHDWTAVLRRRPARIVAAAQKAASPTCLRSSAATAVTRPTSITAKSHRSFNGPAGHTRSQPGSPRMKNTSGCTAHPSASPRLADTPKFQPVMLAVAALRCGKRRLRGDNRPGLARSGTDRGARDRLPGAGGASVDRPVLGACDDGG